MLTIRLTRKGKKNQPFFRVVVIDKRKSSTAGKVIENLGYVDPLKKRKSFEKERILYWISKGAQPSVSIHNLLVTEKIIDAKKIKVSNKKKSTEAPTATTAVPKPAEQAGIPAAQSGLGATPATATVAPAATPAPTVAPAASEVKPAEQPKPEPKPAA